MRDVGPCSTWRPLVEARPRCLAQGLSRRDDPPPLLGTSKYTYNAGAQTSTAVGEAVPVDGGPVSEAASLKH